MGSEKSSVVGSAKGKLRPGSARISEHSTDQISRTSSRASSSRKQRRGSAGHVDYVNTNDAQRNTAEDVKSERSLSSSSSTKSKTISNSKLSQLGLSSDKKKREPLKIPDDIAPMFEDQHVSAIWKFFKKPKKPKLTSNIGKTIGVPNIGPYGVMPVRTHIRPHSDSMDHNLYLRVVSADDPAGTQPYSILKLVDDRKKERMRIIESRNNERYKTVTLVNKFVLFL